MLSRLLIIMNFYQSMSILCMQHFVYADIVFCVGGSKQKECFIYHKVASVLYEK